MHFILCLAALSGTHFLPRIFFSSHGALGGRETWSIRSTALGHMVIFLSIFQFLQSFIFSQVLRHGVIPGLALIEVLYLAPSALMYIVKCRITYYQTFRSRKWPPNQIQEKIYIAHITNQNLHTSTFFKPCITNLKVKAS
jgi:hypothetical protein